jgi:3-methyladenine DNA glycosylase AlkC
MSAADASVPQREPFKELFNAAAVERLANRLAPHVPGFDAAAFVSEVKAALEPLALLQRVDLITRSLNRRLPSDFPKALDCILNAMGEDHGRSGVEGMEDFQYLPLLHYVGLYGVPHYERSIAALERMTCYFSAEWDIRYFILAEPEKTMTHLKRFARNPDPRVRRLATEGTRPRLPWATRLNDFIRDPTPTLEILEILKDDENQVVRRSVANHLNDISKDHPERLISVLERWNEGASEERRWVIRHALRTLVKAGHPGALKLLGFADTAPVRVLSFSLAPRRLVFGDALSFSFELQLDGVETCNLSIDYALHLLKANGKTAPKVFKLATRSLARGEFCKIEKRHPIYPITTRKYYAGPQELELLVNGHSVGRLPFELVMPDGLLS